MALTAALIAAVFIAAAFAQRHPPGWLTGLGLGVKASFWLASVLLSLPLFSATFGYHQALGLLLDETKVTEAPAGARTAAIRAVAAQVVPISGLSGIVGARAEFRAPATFNTLLVRLAIVALLIGLLWRSFIKAYAKAQMALQETFAQQPVAPSAHAPAAFRSLLREANLETVSIAADSPAAGRFIRELELRTRTSASIVGIERSGTNIINPGPDEELQSGEQVPLLGRREHLEAARSQLRG